MRRFGLFGSSAAARDWIRMAIGAPAGDIVRRVTSEVFAMVLVGAAALAAVPAVIRAVRIDPVAMLRSE